MSRNNQGLRLRPAFALAGRESTLFGQVAHFAGTLQTLWG